MKEINHDNVEINQNERLPRYLYHYTRINCLKDIFNDKYGKNVCIRFTDMHFLNDIDEGIYFYKFLEEHKDEIIGQFKKGDEQEYCRKSIDEFLNGDCYKYLLQEKYGRQYSFSLSELRDSMYFWQADYAKENGIALRLDTKTYSSCEGTPFINQVCYFNVDSVGQFLPDFRNIVKEESEFVNCQNDLDDDGSPYRQMSGSRILTTKTPFWVIKAKTWEPEKEWRMVRSINALTKSISKRTSVCRNHTETENINQEKINVVKETFKVDDRGVPRYYLEMPNPFSEIILGPTFSKKYVASISDWLDEHKYQGITVSRSEGLVGSRR